MADRYLVGVGTSIWNSASSWSATSGGASGVSIPTAADNVFLDSNSPDLQIDDITDITAECNNFDCTGFNGIIIMWVLDGMVRQPSHLIIHGDVNLSPTTTINGNPDYPSNVSVLDIYGVLNIDSSTLTDLRLTQYGLLGSIQNVTATNIDSSHGRKIYASGSTTLTTCLNWSTSAPPGTIHISTVQNLKDINNDLTADYILDNDIDLTGEDWCPIGVDPINFASVPVAQFVGTFNGQGFTISNLSVSLTQSNKESCGGLFGFIGNNAGQRAFIQNLKLQNVDLTGIYGLGGICGFMITGAIINCTVKNITIHGDPDNPLNGVQAAGGIGGDCFATAIANLPSIVQGCHVDGFVCYNSRLFTVGALLGEGIDSPEGFIIADCSAKNVNIGFSTPNADGNGPQQVGGLVGAAKASFNKCFASGQMNFSLSGGDDIEYIGGLVGDAQGSEIINTYSAMEINVTTTDSMFFQTIGGLVGSAYGGFIENSYSRSNITITADAGGSEYAGVGGLSGALEQAETVQNCYAVGVITVDTVDTGMDTIGGFLGHIMAASPITNCSWWTDVYDWAIGTDANSNTHRSLTTEGFGTDEADNTAFYLKTHVVYAQGT